MAKERAGWEVAAAILIVDDIACNIEYLALKVARTKLSGLGKRGGKAFAATLGVELRDHDDIFQRNGRGEYQIADQGLALRQSGVQSVIYLLVEEKVARYHELLRSRLLLSQLVTSDDVQEFEHLETDLRRLSRLYVGDFRLVKPSR